MFKNATLYRFTRDPNVARPTPIEDHLQARAFTPCAPSQEKSVGWVPPRGEAHGPLRESVSGQWIFKLMVESKRVPAEVLQRAVAEACAQIEADTGRKPGKKQRKEIAEDAKLTLLPMAFAIRSSVLVWLDPVSGVLLIDTTSAALVDEVVSQLVFAINGFSLQPIITKTLPADAMAHWLSDDDCHPAGFALDRACELHAPDETKAKVKYSNHALDIPEIRQHLTAGKVPVRLGMTYDGRVSFTLTDGLTLKGIAFLDGTIDVGATLDSDVFDVDVTLATGELQRLIPSLLAALDGEPVAL